MQMPLVVINNEAKVQCLKCGKIGTKKDFKKFCPHCCVNSCKEFDEVYKEVTRNGK